MILLNLLFFVLSLVLLYFGADFLIKGSVKIALRLKISKTIIGLTFVALGTSMPEFVISLVSRIQGSSDIPIGNGVGSSIANIGLVLGLSALIRPMNVDKMLNKRDMPVLIGITLIFSLFSLNGIFGWTEGLIIFSLFTAYMIFIVKMGKKKSHTSEISEAEVNNYDNKKVKLSIAIGLGVLGLGLLVGGAQLLVYSGTNIARKLGVSELVISITMIAVGTSLPELFTSIIAVIKNEVNISIGNIIGSNIFNISFVLGSTSFFGNLSVKKQVYSLDNWVMLGLTVLLLPFLITNNKLKRYEGGILFAIYVGYITNIFVKFI